MKKIIVYLLLIFGMNIIQANDITINDGYGSYDTGWYSQFYENNEVEIGNFPSQLWDMEKFVINENSRQLMMIWGYNFTDPQGIDGMRPGDLFINIGYDNVYDYVAVANFENSTYSLYTLGNVYNVYYGQNNSSNPWKYKDGGFLVGDGLSVEYLSFIDYEGIHYVALFDVNWIYEIINSGELIKFHYTMECGNDNLLGQYIISIPEMMTTNIVCVLLCMIGFNILKKYLHF